MEAHGDGMAWRAGDGAATARRGEPATMRRGDSTCAARRDKPEQRPATAPGPRHGWASAVEHRATGYSVSIHVDRSNEAIGDGDDVFTRKKLAMGHFCFIFL